MLTPTGKLVTPPELALTSAGGPEPEAEYKPSPKDFRTDGSPLLQSVEVESVMSALVLSLKVATAWN